MSESPLGQAMMRTFGEQARPAVMAYDLNRATGAKEQTAVLKRAAIEHDRRDFENWPTFDIRRTMDNFAISTSRTARAEAIFAELCEAVDLFGITDADSRIVLETNDYQDTTTVRLATKVHPRVYGWWEKAQRTDAAEAEVASLRAELAAIREATGYSTGNAPALGGSKAASPVPPPSA